MKCPIDSTDLVMAERQDIEIDYCPKCRGVWLDRGELDKIIERSARTAPTPRNRDHDDGLGRQHSYSRQDDHGYEQLYRGKKKRKSSFLGELFDFGD